MLDVHGSLESDEQLVKSHTHTQKKRINNLYLSSMCLDSLLTTPQEREPYM